MERGDHGGVRKGNIWLRGDGPKSKEPGVGVDSSKTQEEPTSQRQLPALGGWGSDPNNEKMAPRQGWRRNLEKGQNYDSGKGQKLEPVVQTVLHRPRMEKQPGFWRVHPSIGNAPVGAAGALLARCRLAHPPTSPQPACHTGGAHHKPAVAQ